MKTTSHILSFILILAFLTACTPAPTALPTATASATPVPTATITLFEPEPLLPPSERPGSEYPPLAVSPPMMNPGEVTFGQIVKDGVKDESAAAAVYALVRTEQEPQFYQDEEEYLQKMDQYLKAHLNLSLIQVDGEGIVYSMLVNKKGQIYLVFDDKSGALAFAEPGYWSKKGHGEWVDAADVANGESVSLVPGKDGHAYVVKLDADGNVIAYLNTHQATNENIDEQWIEVIDGMPVVVWEEGKWVEIEREPEYVVDFSSSLTPETIEDVAGVVRREHLQADLARLHEEINRALEAEGVTADQLPFILVNNFIPKNSLDDLEFFPSEYNGRVQTIDMNNERQARAVLTSLDTGDGYVLTMPVDPDDGSGEIRLADFVIDYALLDALEVKRAASGSRYVLFNKQDEDFLANKLLPGFKEREMPDFFAPFGELRDEYVPYAGLLVEADRYTSEDEIGAQIQAGRVFLVVRCNLR